MHARSWSLAVWLAVPLAVACGGSSPKPGGVMDASTDGVSVLEHHHSAMRNGVYVDAALTRQAAAGVHRDPGFDANARVNGPVYAQPLYLEAGNGSPDRVFVATEQNEVYAFDAQTGAQAWHTTLAPPVPLSALPCGNIDPLGITGTPVIDAATRTIYLDAMTTPDGGATKKHLVYALSADDGTVRSGWPADVGALVSGFDSAVQNQRGGLLLLGGKVYVPYGGHYGDCGTYYGRVVGIDVRHPGSAVSFRTRAEGGGIWAPGGLASDGASVFAATGNTFGAANWQDGEAILRLPQDLAFTQQPQDFWAPTDWMDLDSGDVDIGGSGPVLFDLPGGTPAHAAIALGKNGKAYLLDRDHLGGVSDAVATLDASGGEIINSAAAYQTPTASYVAFAGSGASCGGSLAAIRISLGSPASLESAWCADTASGSPIYTTTGGGKDGLVWSIGGSPDRLHAFDADTGAEVFAGGGAGDAMGNVERYQTPIVAKGRIYVAADDALYAFTP